MSVELTPQQAAQRANHRLEHIAVLRTKVADPDNPQHAVHAAELLAAERAQHAYESQHGPLPAHQPATKGNERQRAEERAINRFNKIEVLRRLLADPANPLREKHQAELECAERAQRAYEEGAPAIRTNPEVHEPAPTLLARIGAGPPQSIPVTVGSGGSALSVQRVADSSTWTAVQAMPILTGDGYGWRDFEVTVILADKGPAQPPTENHALSAAIRKMTHPSPVGDRVISAERTKSILSAPMRYRGEPANSHSNGDPSDSASNASTDGVGGSKSSRWPHDMFLRRRPADPYEDDPRPYAKKHRTRSKRRQPQNAYGAMLGTVTSGWGEPGNPIVAGDSVQAKTVIAGPGSTSATMGKQPTSSLAPATGAAAAASIVRPHIAGAVHPSRLGMVPGTSTATSPPVNPTISKEQERIESQIVGGLATPLSLDGLEQVEPVGSDDQLVDPEMLLGPTPEGLAVLDDEELEECPPAMGLVPSLGGDGMFGGKRKRSATPTEEEMLESLVGACEERPIVTKKAKRQLC